MSSEPNETFVAARDGWLLWRFTIDPTPNETLSESLLALYGRFESAFDGLVHPVEVAYTITASDASDDETTGTVVDEDGVTSEMLAEAVERKAEADLFDSYILSELCLIRAEVRVTLSNGTRWITGDDGDYYRSIRSGKGSLSPSSAPILQFRCETLLRDQPVHRLVIKTDSDIWIADTQIGRENAERLGTALRELRGNVSVLESRFYPDDGMGRLGATEADVAGLLSDGNVDSTFQMDIDPEGSDMTVGEIHYAVDDVSILGSPVRQTLPDAFEQWSRVLAEVSEGLSSTYVDVEYDEVEIELEPHGATVGLTVFESIDGKVVPTATFEVEIGQLVEAIASAVEEYRSSVAEQVAEDSVLAQVSAVRTEIEKLHRRIDKSE
jgi:hypothetical protein